MTLFADIGLQIFLFRVSRLLKAFETDIWWWCRLNCPLGLRRSTWLLLCWFTEAPLSELLVTLFRLFEQLSDILVLIKHTLEKEIEVFRWLVFDEMTDVIIGHWVNRLFEGLDRFIFTHRFDHLESQLWNTLLEGLNFSCDEVWQFKNQYLGSVNLLFSSLLDLLCYSDQFIYSLDFILQSDLIFLHNLLVNIGFTNSIPDCGP